jgi:hypothetical protein
MRARLLILACMLILCSMASSASNVYYPLQNRVKDADFIVTGKLTNVVQERFSMVYHGYIDGPGEVESWGRAEHEYVYSTAELVFDEVLKGEPRPNQRAVAFPTEYRKSPPDKGIPGMKPAWSLQHHDGEQGIWLLQVNHMPPLSYYLTVLTLIPADSLEAVREYIVRDRYIGGQSYPSRQRAR